MDAHGFSNGGSKVFSLSNKPYNSSETKSRSYDVLDDTVAGGHISSNLLRSNSVSFKSLVKWVRKIVTATTPILICRGLCRHKIAH